jgi:hypothetical protein
MMHSCSCSTSRKPLIADESVRVIDLDGQLLRQLTLDPTGTYQPITAT